MQQLSRQAASKDLHRPSSSSGTRQQALVEGLCKKSKRLKSIILAGASSLGLNFAYDQNDESEAETLEQLSWNLNEIEELWGEIVDNVGQERSEQLQQQTYAKVNDEYLLGCMVTVRALTETLTGLFKLVMEATVNRETYEYIKKAAELITSLGLTLNKYRSADPEFNDTKQQYGQLDKVVIEFPRDDSNVSKNSTAATPAEQYHLKKQQQTNELTNKLKLAMTLPTLAQQLNPNETCDHEQYIEQLREQITRLQQSQEQNNRQFAEQVQKYNAILYEQQQELRNCEGKFLEFEQNIHQLQTTIVRLREEKHRDQLLIEYILGIFRNMSKKLRQYERDLGIPVSGTTTFGSSLYPSPRSQVSTGVFRRSPSPQSRNTYGNFRTFANSRAYQ